MKKTNGNQLINHQTFVEHHHSSCLFQSTQQGEGKIEDMQVYRISCGDDKSNGLNASRFQEMSLKLAFEEQYGVKSTELIGEIIP